MWGLRGDEKGYGVGEKGSGGMGRIGLGGKEDRGNEEEDWKGGG